MSEFKKYKKLIFSKGVGSNNESWWYLVFRLDDGHVFVEHEWNNMSYSLNIDQGVKLFEMQELLIEHPQIFNQAVTKIEQTFND